MVYGKTGDALKEQIRVSRTFSETQATLTAKSRDHEIVRDQRECPKAVPRIFQNHVVWSRALKWGVKSYVARPSTKCYFNEFLCVWVLTHDKI
jgi:hypothetical protein